MSVKFTHFKNALKGSSAKVIDGFAVTKANHTEAMELLQQMYKDNGCVLRKLCKQSLELKSPNRTYKELLEFKISYDQILRSLRTHHNVKLDS